MTRKRRRLYLVLGGLTTAGVVTALALNGMSGSLVFFYSPTELYAQHIEPGQYVRIGGLVANGSVEHKDNGITDFKVTDGKESLPVAFKGPLPDLFREGQGVVIEGSLATNGTFAAKEVLAKHDENYMPPDVVAALKKSGRWQEGSQTAAKTGMAQ